MRPNIDSQTCSPDRRFGRLFGGARTGRGSQAGHRNDHSAAGSPIVMVVDDDASMRDTVSLALSGLGYHVMRATDGEEALSLLEETPGEVSVLITDVVMPRLDGPGLAAAVAHRHPATRVIFMSGYENLLPANRRRLASDQACLFKPFSLVVLEQAVNDALEPEADNPGRTE